MRNLVNRSASRLLLEPLAYHQVAPVGFMVVEKGISRILGESDLAFRALLLPIGLAALVLFLPLAERLLDGFAVPFAVAAFAIGAPFIRYSAEVKSYGIDIAATVALSLLTLRLRDPDATAARCVLAGVAGAVLVWFSQPTVFVLAGLGAALVLAWLRDRDAQTRRGIGVTVPLWAAASAAATLVALGHVTPATRAYMDFFWRIRNGFFPRPFRKPGDLLWLWDRVLELLNDPTVLRYRWPALYGALGPSDSWLSGGATDSGRWSSSGPSRWAFSPRSPSSSRSRRAWPSTPFPCSSSPRPRARSGPPAGVAPSPRGGRTLHGRALPRAGVGVRPDPAAALGGGPQDRVRLFSQAPPARRRRLRLSLRGRGRGALRRRVWPRSRRLPGRFLLARRPPGVPPRRRSVPRPGARLAPRRERSLHDGRPLEPRELPRHDRSPRRRRCRSPPRNLSTPSARTSSI